MDKSRFETGADWLVRARREWDQGRAQSPPRLVEQLKLHAELDARSGVGDHSDAARKLMIEALVAIENLHFTQQVQGVATGKRKPMTASELLGLVDAKPKRGRKTLCRDLVGKYALLTRRVETKGGVVLPKGQRVFIQQTYRGRFRVVGVAAQSLGRTPVQVDDENGLPMQCSGVPRSALLLEGP